MKKYVAFNRPTALVNEGFDPAKVENVAIRLLSHKKESLAPTLLMKCCFCIQAS
jgi:hypothetical protein